MPYRGFFSANTKNPPTYHILKMAEQQEAEREFEAVNFAEYIRVSDERLLQIQRATEHDQNLQALENVILTGWPQSSDEIPFNIREFWTYRDGLAVHNGILYKGPRVIIPKALQPAMLIGIHSSHLGEAACLRKARDDLFWPGMAADIKAFVEKCRVCNEIQSSNSKEPLMSHELPD